MLDGEAGGTQLTKAEAILHRPADWRNAPAQVTVAFDAATTSGLVRQVGLAAAAVTRDQPAHVEISGSGVPKDGLDTTVRATLAGIDTRANGKLVLGSDFTPTFAGNVQATSGNLDLAMALAGLGIPAAPFGIDADLTGALTSSADGAELEWSKRPIGGHLVGRHGDARRGGDRTWRIGGNVDVDEADLGWLMSLGLGFAPMPTGDPAQPWSKTPFISPVYGAVIGKLAVSADHLAVGDGLDACQRALRPRRCSRSRSTST